MTVADVLRARREAGSRPGARSDGHRVALAIEGGGNRAAYSAGMCLAIDELGLTDCFDAVYGTSGGALNAAWLLTGEAQRWLPSWASPEVAAAGVTDPRRLLRGGPVVDLEVLVGHVYERLTPMDFEAILANPITLHPIATDARTGESADLAPHLTDRVSVQTALRASACMPLLAGRPVPLGGRTFVDGGLSEAVPWPTAVAQGATHVLVLRTRREGQLPAGSRLERLALAPYFLRHARGAGRSHRVRHEHYRSTDAARHESAHLTQVRPPPGAHDVSRLTKDLASIESAIAIGHAALIDALSSSPA
ncbi:putative patatin/cPLA2 family phospholipase [Nocardioides thalensis]|uniref:Putative patatin/cPLA2 family phospholipase n=1 Tax=Nocardioides thalensis TaxID=1914755 RepID=A0A853C0M3_9ACTN|nr:patatin family protein [Nocardioides thalensis]NYJ01790.1 putative patatin/cPLA2 family phospholipase [Nocardioides thalensis]